MVNPAGKAPSKSRVKDSMSDSERIRKHGPAIKKFFPQFSQLTKPQQASLALNYAVQDYMKDSKHYEEDYSNKGIREKGLRFLGVAAGKAGRTETVGEDDAGRPKYMFQQKEKNPAGYAYGGRIHRGRKAMRGSD